MMKIIVLFSLILLFIQCGRTKSKDSSNITEPKLDTVNIVEKDIKFNKKIIHDTLFLEKCYTKGHYGSVNQNIEKMPDGKYFLVEQTFIVDSTKLLQFDTITENSKTIIKRHYKTYDGYTDIKISSEDSLLIFRKTLKPLERKIKKKNIHKITQDFYFSNYYKLECFSFANNSVIISSYGAEEYCVCDTLGNLKHVGFSPPLTSNINKFINSLNIYITCTEIYDIGNSEVFLFSNLSKHTLLRYFIIENNIYLIFDSNDINNEANDVFVLSQDLKVQQKSKIKIRNSRSEVINHFNSGNKTAIFSHLTDSLLIIENKPPYNIEWFSIDSIKPFENNFIYHDELYFNCSSPLENMILYVDTINYEFRKEFHERLGD